MTVCSPNVGPRLTVAPTLRPWAETVNVCEYNFAGAAKMSMAKEVPVTVLTFSVQAVMHVSLVDTMNTVGDVTLCTLDALKHGPLPAKTTDCPTTKPCETFVFTA